MTGVIVDIDPMDAGPDWMYVVIHGATGVRYWHQYGGTNCLQGYPEGYLVPVYGAEARRDLDRLFIGELGGAGVPVQLLDDFAQSHETSFRERVAGILAAIHIRVADAGAWDPVRGASSPLRLDEDRVRELNEAWIPVLSPAGPATLIWPNSD